MNSDWIATVNLPRESGAKFWLDTVVVSSPTVVAKPVLGVLTNNHGTFIGYAATGKGIDQISALWKEVVQEDPDIQALPRSGSPRRFW
jgi:hypothetical protein